jgi:hypothetical protein
MDSLVAAFPDRKLHVLRHPPVDAFEKVAELCRRRIPTPGFPGISTRAGWVPPGSASRRSTGFLHPGKLAGAHWYRIVHISRKSPVGVRRPSCSRRTKRGGWRRTSPSCRSC